MKRFVVQFFVVFAALALSASAAGQTTRPAEAWGDAVNRLADAVRGKDVAALSTLLQRGPIIRTFASESLQTPERLLGSTTGARLLGVHAYLALPTTLASDLASDLQSAADLPEQVRENMTPPDEAAAKRANDTAGQWLAQLLQPEKDQPVAVILLWRESHDSFTPASKRPLFVLVKGDLTDGGYTFRQIIFGDPLEANR